MKNCPNAKRVLVDATFAITHFIEDDDNRLMAIEKGAIEMVRSALDTFDGDAELMEVAYPCLTLLGEDVEEEKRQLKDKFGIDGLLRTCGTTKTTKLSRKSLLGYRYISTRPLHRDPSTTNFQKAPDLISAIIKFGKDNIDLSNYALQACHHLSKIKQNRIFIIRSGLLDSVISAMN